MKSNLEKKINNINKILVLYESERDEIYKLIIKIFDPVFDCMIFIKDMINLDCMTETI